MGDEDGYYHCEICKVLIKNCESSISRHNAGSKHTKKTADQMVLLRLAQEYDCFEQDSEYGFLRCVICNIVLTTTQSMEAHFKSSKHKSKVVGVSTNDNANTPGKSVVNGGYWCEICKRNIKATPALHIAGNKHKKKQASFNLLQKLREKEDCIVQDALSDVLKCCLCNCSTNSAQELQAHLAGKRHIILRAARDVNVEKIADCKLKISNLQKPNAVALHMQEPKHLRQVASNELLLKLKDITAKHNLRVEGSPFKRKCYGDSYHTHGKRIQVDPNLEDVERTVFLRNFPFNSTEEDIRSVFEDCGEIESFHHIKSCNGWSKGYGFLCFKNKMAAVKALGKDKTVLAKCRIRVSAYILEGRKAKMDDNRSGECKKDRLFVSGLPGTMTEEEIRTLFEPHGEIKNLTMIMKSRKVFKGICYLGYGDEETAAFVKEATDKFVVGTRKKITVRFSNLPRPRKGRKATITQS